MDELSQGDVLEALHSVLEREFSDTFRPLWLDHTEFWAGQPPGEYNVVAVYCHVFVEAVEPVFHAGAGAVQPRIVESLAEVFRVIEGLLERGSRPARGLVVVGFLEGVQNLALSRDLELNALQPFLGDRGRRAWAWLNRIWVGRATLASVVRAEVRGELEEPDW